MRAAAVQLNSTEDRARNLEIAERLIREAAADGSELVVLPEKWTILAGPDELRAGAEPLDGPSLTAVAGWARELGIHLVAGSIAERVEDREKLFNTSVLFSPDGELAAVYRTIQDEIRSRYLVAYQSSNTTESRAFREVEVRVARSGLEVKAMRGYYP